MAKAVTINVKINTKDGVKSIGDLNQEVKTTLNSLGAMEDASRLLNEELRKVEVGSAEYERLRQEIVSVNTEIRNQELAMEALDNEQVASELKSVAGGFADIASGIAFIGASNKNLEQLVQTVAKIEGVTRIVTGGMEAFSSVMKLQNNIATKLTAAQAALSAAQLKGGITGKAAAVGMRILNAVMSANPVFLLIGAFALLSAAFVLFTGNADTATAANNAFNKSLKETADNNTRVDENIRRSGKFRLDLAEAQGASEEKLHKIRLDNIKAEEDLRLFEMNSILKNNKTLREQKKLALSEGNEDLYKSITEDIEANTKRYKDLSLMSDIFYHDTLLENLNYQKKLAEDNKTMTDKEKARLADYYKELEALRRKNEDAILAINFEGFELQFKQNKVNYDRLRKDLLADMTKTANEKAKLKAQLDKAEELENRKIQDAKNEYEIENIKLKTKKIEKITADSEKKKIEIEEEARQAALDAYNAAVDKQFQKRVEELNRFSSITNKFASDIITSADLIGQVLTNINNKQMDQINESFKTSSESLKSDLANRVISQEQYNEQVALLEQKKNQEELDAKRKAFKQSKSLQLVNATMTGAQAVMAAYASGFATPIIGPATAAIFAGIATALSAAQIGIIASQQFRAARGGVVPGVGSGKFDSVNALLAPGETVINSNSSKMFPELLSNINQAGGGVSLIPNSGVSSQQTNNNNNNNNNSNNSQPNVIRAYVVESEISQSQKRINRIERSVEFK